MSGVDTVVQTVTLTGHAMFCSLGYSLCTLDTENDIMLFEVRLIYQR